MMNGMLISERNSRVAVIRERASALKRRTDFILDILEHDALLIVGPSTNPWFVIPCCIRGAWGFHSDGLDIQNCSLNLHPTLSIEYIIHQILSESFKRTGFNVLGSSVPRISFLTPSFGWPVSPHTTPSPAVSVPSSPPLSTSDQPPLHQPILSRQIFVLLWRVKLGDKLWPVACVSPTLSARRWFFVEAR